MTRNQSNRGASLLDASIRQIVREEFRSMLEGASKSEDDTNTVSQGFQGSSTSLSQSKLAGRTVTKRSTARKGMVTNQADRRLKKNRVEAADKV